MSRTQSSDTPYEHRAPSVVRSVDRQLSEGSSGYVATIASSLRCRRSTARHSPSGPRRRHVARLRLHHVPGALAPVPLQLARAPARVPGEDPQRAERRREQFGRGLQVDQADRAVHPAPAQRRPWRRPPGSPGTTARPSAESSETGPPWKTTPGSPASSPRPPGCPRRRPGSGRLRTTPSEPSSSWSRRSTTARSKFGSARAGVATSSRPVSEDTSVMADMIPHIRARGARRQGARTRRSSAREERDPASSRSDQRTPEGRSATVTDSARSVLSAEVMTSRQRPVPYGTGVSAPYPLRLRPLSTPSTGTRDS